MSFICRLLLCTPANFTFLAKAFATNCDLWGYRAFAPSVWSVLCSLNLAYTDRIPFLQENSEFRKNPETKSGEAFFRPNFQFPFFYSGIPGFFPFTHRFSTDAGPQSNLLISSQARPVLLPGQGGTNRGALLLLAPCAALPALLPRLPTPACSWASGHGLLATLGSTQKLWAK